MPTLLDDEVQSPEVQDDQVLFAAASVDLGRNRVPGRGLLYSFLVHEIVILWILCHPGSYSTKERHFRLIEQIPLESELLLPPVGGGDSGASGQEGATKRVRGKNKKRGASRGKAAVNHLYPGPQPMASKSPNPDNSFQTILQPDLIKPPILKVPLPLPNMMQLAATLPPPPPAAHKIFEPPAPPQPPEAPKLHGNLRSAAIEIPVLVPPPAPVKPKITLPPPSQEVAALHTLATASRLRELAKATPSLTAPVAPQNPPSRASSAGTDTRNILALSVFPSTSRLAIQVPQVEAHGDFAIGPHPPTAGPEPGTTRGDSTEISSLPPEISGPGLAALGKGLASEASPVGEAGNGPAQVWNQDQVWDTPAWDLGAAPKPGQAPATANRAVPAPEREQGRVRALARVWVLAQGHSPECRSSAVRGVLRAPALAALLGLRPRAPTVSRSLRPGRVEAGSGTSASFLTSQSIPCTST